MRPSPSLLGCARWWVLAALVGYALVARGVGLPPRPDGNAFGPSVTRAVELGLLGVVVVAWAVARRRAGLAAVVLAIAAAGLTGQAALSYHPVVAFVVAAVFAPPAAALWLVWQRGRSAVATVVAVVATATIAATTWAVALSTYDRYFGPTHPSSHTADVPVDRVEWAWSGGVTARRASVVARLAGRTEGARRVELEVQPVPVTTPTTPTTPEAGPEIVPGRPDEDRVVRWNLDALRPGTDYSYAVVVDGHRDRGRGVGRFGTPPEGPAPVTVAFGSCARTGSNGAVFDAIRAVAPDIYIAEGDLHYGNVTDDDRDAFLDLYDRVLTAPAQAALYRSVPVAYVWDDHDYGANNADAGSSSRDAARRAYRQAVPHHFLPAGRDRGAIYQAFTVGRVRFVLTDTRSERTDASMLGERQLDWLLRELRTASPTHALVVWVNPDPWIAPAAPGRDDWGGHPDERQRIADAIATTGTHNLVMLSGDAHMVALDDGTNSDYSTTGDAGFPILHAAALDRPGQVKGGPYSHGAFPGGGQFGVLRVEDHGGDHITVGLAGRDWSGHTIVEHSFRVTVPTAAHAAPPTS